MNVKELLLALNLKAAEHHVSYTLQYNYQYSYNAKRLYSKVLLLKFTRGKLTEKMLLKTDLDTIIVLDKEIKQYA